MPVTFSCICPFPGLWISLANGWQLQTPITDSHRQVIRHAGRTNKKPAPFLKPAFWDNVDISERVCALFNHEICNSSSCIFQIEGFNLRKPLQA